MKSRLISLGCLHVETFVFVCMMARFPVFLYCQEKISQEALAIISSQHCLSFHAKSKQLIIADIISSSVFFGLYDLS